MEIHLTLKSDDKHVLLFGPSFGTEEMVHLHAYIVDIRAIICIDAHPLPVWCCYNILFYFDVFKVTFVNVDSGLDLAIDLQTKLFLGVAVLQLKYPNTPEQSTCITSK